MNNYTAPNIKDPIINRAFQDTYKFLNELSNAVNKPQSVMGRGDIGKSGDIQFIAGEDNSGYLLVKGKDEYYSTFEGCFAPFQKTPKELHLRNLTVDNLFAKTFTARQINAQNGDVVYSDMGEVDHIAGDDVFFKDSSNLNLCSFAVHDLVVARRLAMDKSLDIKYVKGTVTAVVGNKITVTYEDTNKFAKGDIVVRVGNTTDATRQDNIYVCTNLTGSPYIDINDGIASFANWDAHAPTVRIGKLTEIVDSNFNSVAPYKLSGYGIYGENVYMKGKFQIASVDDLIGFPTIITTYRQTATPSAPKTGDLWYDINTGQVILKRYNGSTWDAVGTDGTYIDANGIYTGTLVAQNIIAGTGLVANLSVLSTLTMGSAATDGYIQSYGWNGTANGFQIKGGATPSATLIGGTITGGTIQTAASGARVTLDASGFRLYSTGKFSAGSSDYYYSTTRYMSMGLMVDLGAVTGAYIDAGSADFYLTTPMIYVSGGISSAASKFIINSTGQITKINNVVTSGYVPISNGTHYEPRALLASDLPNAVADGSTKGVCAFTAADFNATTGVISIDYTNGQAASTSAKGFLTNTDWNTFNGKASAFTGVTNTVAFMDADGYIHTVTIANGIITGWAIA